MNETKHLFETNVNKYTWVEFYMEFASKLVHYKNNRIKLIEKIKNVFKIAGMETNDKEICGYFENVRVRIVPTIT